jgi:hypothetical protein
MILQQFAVSQLRWLSADFSLYRLKLNPNDYK